MILSILVAMMIKLGSPKQQWEYRAHYEYHMTWEQIRETEQINRSYHAKQPWDD